jgi:anion-transporting  ArsA/GET3 family ATPase
MFSLVTASFGLFSRAVQKILGAQLLTDLSGFVAALDSMFGGFRQRADETYRILQDPQTAFLLVAAPERDAIREAAYFAERLVAERMPLAGLVLNRIHQAELTSISAEAAEAAATALEHQSDQQITADTLRIHAALLRQTEREVREAATFTTAFPDVATVSVTAQPADVHDVDGLRTIGEALTR